MVSPWVSPYKFYHATSIVFDIGVFPLLLLDVYLIYRRLNISSLSCLKLSQREKLTHCQQTATHKWHGFRRSNGKSLIKKPIKSPLVSLISLATTGTPWLFSFNWRSWRCVFVHKGSIRGGRILPLKLNTARFLTTVSTVVNEFIASNGHCQQHSPYPSYPRLLLIY